MVAMPVEDYYDQAKRSWLRLREKGGKRHKAPAHHNREASIDAYLGIAGIADAPQSPLFRTVPRIQDQSSEPRCSPSFCGG